MSKDCEALKIISKISWYNNTPKTTSTDNCLYEKRCVNPPRSIKSKMSIDIPFKTNNYLKTGPSNNHGRTFLVQKPILIW